MNSGNLLEIIREQYNLVRSNPKKVDEVIEYLKSMNDEVGQIRNHRAISFFSLKNDLILQRDLNIENVENYIIDLRHCMKHRLYTIESGDEESIFKIFEMIAKIQIAINLLGEKLSLKPIYENMLLEFGKNFRKHLSLFRGKKVTYDNYQLIFIYDMYYLFIPDFDDSVIPNPTMKRMMRSTLYGHILKKIFFRLNEHKFTYYKKDTRFITKMSLLKYNFVYE